jgi:hypothetical protein
MEKQYYEILAECPKTKIQEIQVPSFNGKIWFCRCGIVHYKTITKIGMGFMAIPV